MILAVAFFPVRNDGGDLGKSKVAVRVGACNVVHLASARWSALLGLKSWWMGVSFSPRSLFQPSLPSLAQSTIAFLSFAPLTCALPVQVAWVVRIRSLLQVACTAGASSFHGRVGGRVNQR